MEFTLARNEMAGGEILMKKIIFFISLTIFLGAGAAAFYFSNKESPVLPSPDYQLISKTCWFKIDWRKKVKCFHLKTSQEQGVFFLPVVVIVDESEDRRSDPVLYLQGGPGAGAGLNQQGIDRWLNWVELAGLKRDLILMDQRGTGESLPKLNCNDKGEQIRSWKRNDSLLEELQANNQAMLNCFDDLAIKNSALNIQNFSTAISAKDILHLMQQLNYPQWNLLGVSYGTRLALELESQQGKAVGLKSLVLDSVYPAAVGGVQTWPDVLGEALDRFYEGCLSQAECKSILGEESPKILFTESLEKLKKTPVRLSIKRWDGEAPVDFIVNDHRFLSAVWLE
jgi:pimeloyl-ACP methyl ester carboxylesterase